MMKDMENQYRDLGIAACVDEQRTSCLCMGNDGYYHLAICSKGFILLVNLNTKEVGQYMFPENYVQFSFGSMASRAGKIYLGAGTMFMEFDPVLKEYTYYKRIGEGELSYSAWCQTEDRDGVIYFGAYPKTYLRSFNPKTRELKDYGILDPTQAYAGTLAIDRMGFVYCSIGTETHSIVALNPKTGEKQVIMNNDGASGCAEVCTAKNGEVYGTFSGNLTFTEMNHSLDWYRLYEGRVCEMLKDSSLQNYYKGRGFSSIHCICDERPEILHLDMAGHAFSYIHPETNEKVELRLDYESEGAKLSPLTLGPNGKIYGTTNHPMQIYTCDPSTDTIINYGNKPFIKGPGNICAYASQGAILMGCAYAGGYIERIDTSKEIVTKPGNVNPFYEGANAEIYRPRSAAAYPDGRTLIFGGFAENGITGGGLVVYDVISRKMRAIQNCNLIPYHSVLSMAAMPTGEMLCGTSIEAPCGGYVYATEAVLFGLDIKTDKVLYSLIPIPGAREIAHIKLDRFNIVHAITSESIYFAYHPEERKVLRTVNLSEYGHVVRDGMQCADDGMLYGLLTGGIYRINPEDGEVKVISVPPCDITAGMAVTGSKIYFGSKTHLWCYTI